MKRASSKLVVVLLLMVAMAPLVGAILSGGSSQSALTTDRATALGRSQPECLSPPMYTILQMAAPPVVSSGTIFSSLRSDSVAARNILKTGPVAQRSGGAADPLSNGVSVTGFLNGTGDSQMWYIDVSSGARQMRSVLTSPNSVNFDLYGKLGAYPTTSSHDWIGNSWGSDDVSYNSPTAGRWYIMAYSSSGKGTYLLTVTVLYSSTPQPLTSGATAAGSLNATAASDLWFIDVSSGATSMRCVLTCPLGTDFDVYGRLGSFPDTYSYYWRANAAGNEDFSYGSPGAGRWYIMPFSYFGNGSYELTITIAYAPVAQPLSSGVTATGSLNGSGDYDLWSIYVSSGVTTMRSVLTCPSGANFDLYGACGYYPTTSSYYWCGVSNGSENVVYSSPSSGYWYIMVNSQNGNGTYQLTVTVTMSSSLQSLTSGRTVMGSLSGPAAYDVWYIDVPIGATSMRSVLTCPNFADFDVYGQCYSNPTTTYYAWAGTTTGDENVVYAYPNPGYWYIMVRDRSGFGMYELTVTVYITGSGSDGVQTDLAVIGPVLAIVIVLLFCAVLAVAATGNRGAGGYSGSESTYRQAGVPTRETVIQERRWERTPATRNVQCMRCGASLKAGDDYCWNCGAAAKAGLAAAPVPTRRARGRIRSGICMVCKRGLENADEMLFCPHCGSLAHREHLLEWLHVKNYCPTCGRHLDEATVRKQTEPR